MPGNGMRCAVRELVDAGMLETPSPFERLAQQMEDLLGDGGILKEVIQPGDGPPVPKDASVLCFYSGFLEYSDVPFETTRHLKYPRMMKLGKDVTVLGLSLGLMTMKKGEFSRFLLAPQYAYGTMGCPPLIPASAMILYEVHIIDFFNTGQMDSFISMSTEEQNTLPLSMLIEVVSTVRSFGNLRFNKAYYEGAKDEYKQAVKLLLNRETHNNTEKETIDAALLPLYLNLCISELRLESPRKALKYGTKALEIDSANAKAHFRCGQAYVELQEYESAQRCLIAAQAKKPFDTDINNLLRKVAMCCKESLDVQKDMCLKMFKDLREK